MNDALKWAKKAVEIAPDIAAFQDTLGWIHKMRNELDKAIPALEKAAAVKPRQAEILYHLGAAYAQKGMSKEAADSLNNALSLNSTLPWADDARNLLKKLNVPAR